jgi:hypothetical protein
VADAFGPPPVGQANDEQASVACRLEDAFLTGPDEDRLGDDSDHLLHEHRRARQEPAGVAPLEGGVGVGAEEPERRSIVSSVRQSTPP